MIAAQRQALVAAPVDLTPQAERPAHHETQVPPRLAALLEPLRQVLAGPRRARAVQDADVGALGYPPHHGLGLRGHRLGRISAALRQLNRLDPRHSGQQALVMGHVVGERRT